MHLESDHAPLHPDAQGGKLPAMTLNHYLKQSGTTEYAFAKQIGVTQPTISKLRRRVITPSLSLALAIDAATNGEVTAESFGISREHRPILRMIRAGRFARVTV